MPRINIQELKDHAQSHLKQLIAAHLPNAKRVSGGWRIGSLSGEKGSSCHISDEGTFHDFANKDASGGILDLCKAFSGTTKFSDTLQWVADQTGYTIPPPPERKKATNKVKRELDHLTPEALKYLKGRGLDVDFFPNLPITSVDPDDELNTIALRHLDEAGEVCVAVKYFNYVTKRWSSSSGSNKLLWPLNYVCKEFQSDTDFLIITEGHWDAIAYLENGYPAVSVPNGASVDHWIEECHSFLGSFEQILLSYDSDEAGQEALARVSARLAANVAPPKIIRHPKGCKDANQVLIKHGGAALEYEIEHAEPYTPPEILPASSLVTSAIEAATDSPFELPTPFPRFPFAFRRHESTLYTGYTGHGKSNLVEQFIDHLIGNFEVCAAIASFEDQPDRTVAKMLMHRFGVSGIKDTPEVRDYLSKLHIYNTKETTKGLNDPRKLLDVFTHLYNRWGVTHFVIDNLMTLAVDREDFKGTIEVCELFRNFVNTLPVHLHIVAHPRKPPNTDKNPGPPDPYDVRGPSEIVDMVFNILSICRNIAKERQMDLMRQQGAPVERLVQYDADQHDAILYTQKQRFTGKLPTLRLWHDAEHSNFLTKDQHRTHAH